MFELLGERRAQALNARVRLRDRLPILHEGDVLGAVVKGYRGEITLVSGVLGGLAAVAASMPQQQRFELLAGV